MSASGIRLPAFPAGRGTHSALSCRPRDPGIDANQSHLFEELHQTWAAGAESSERAGDQAPGRSRGAGEVDWATGKPMMSDPVAHLTQRRTAARTPPGAASAFE
jgi:hypothetical protein